VVARIAALFPWAQAQGNPPGRLHHNLGAEAFTAKGTTQDYLTHLIAFPAQIMTPKRAFSGVVKAKNAPERDAAHFNRAAGGVLVPARR
jgi:hypothetical protein